VRARWGLQPQNGPDARLRLNKDIEAAHIVLPLITPRSATSEWTRYEGPTTADLPNQVINHAASAIEAAAAIAVAATAAILQLGFIHEDLGQSFVLDIADRFRDTVTLPVAFQAARRRPGRRTRRSSG
jgi:CRISPR/Cas system-associated endonuclease Cas1